MSQQISKNKFVQFTYRIHNEATGEVVEQVDMPISYVHGADSGMFEKIEAALEGCTAGDEVKVLLSPEEGFGEPDPGMMFTDDIANVPEQYHQIGAEVEFQNDAGDVKTFIVSKIEDGKLTVDGNHPLAGKTIVFTVNVVDVRDATQQEIAEGRPSGQMLH